MTHRLASVVIFTVVLLIPWTELEAEPEPTRVRVRVISRDAKIIGSGVGGATVTIRCLESGRILARGVQEGGTGDTGPIMREPRLRHNDIYQTEGAAFYEELLMLEKPTRVEISAEGPLLYPDSMQSASKTLYLLPGEDVLGEGVILELNGFITELLEIGANGGLRSGQALPLKVRLRMLCGCPIEPGGLWDADKIHLSARLVEENGSVAVETPLNFSGTTNIFQGTFQAPRPGSYQLEILASQASTRNFGFLRRAILIEQ